MRIPVNRDLMEQTEHGSYRFSLAIYENQMDRSRRGSVPMHWHDELQFAVVMQGEVRFRIAQQDYLLRKGEGIFINAGQPHMAEPVLQEGGYRCYDIHPRMLGGYPGSTVEQK